VATRRETGEHCGMSSDVIILFGGRSSERLVSVASAQNISAQLAGAHCWFQSREGAVFVVAPEVLQAHMRPFEAEFHPSDQASWPSLDKALDSIEARDSVFFIALHGGEGENGTTQRLFEERRLAFTGSASVESAAAFDKAHAKRLAQARGVEVADARSVPPVNGAEARTLLSELLTIHPRWVLKPQADGSSVGLIHLRDAEGVDAAAEALASLSVPYLAEVFLEGRELTVVVVDEASGPVALPVSEIRLIPGGSFDYEGKYLGRGTEEITPAPLEAMAWQKAQALAVSAHQAVGCFGYSRTDMILTEAGLVFLEINTLPGLTKASFVPQQLAAAGRSLKAFLEGQLQLACVRQASVAAV
jgi:D-alanine-D-alanine ligase